ncbi:MAG TPA: 4Fe-4S dicluster domain-containing protein [Caldithrix abyssi]|uniref:4Fe-4S dicluster domain-containing protein n=1 Tax=Caldithrix abyssi TaxID=187145 RepID=A0A7V5PQ70_CALAY|nr:4Fe-4S dicluster domain-containing protein [Caldithrix abyssi]
MTWQWRLIDNACTGCGICFDVCPEEAIYMPREAALPEPIPGACIGCMTCSDECPFDAIEVLELEPA